METVVGEFLESLGLNCKDDADKKHCFVQWYEVVNMKSVKVHQTDRGLGCIRLREHRSAEISDSSSVSKEYVLIQVESVKDVVHVVEQNFEHCHLHPTACREREFQKLHCEGQCWLIAMYYVNRLINYKNCETR